MAFILRAKCDCVDQETADNMVKSLTTMASLQDIHPGVVMYHFCRPEPEKRPHYYEFTELYGNEAAFFGHSSDQKFIEAYGAVWPTKKITSVTYGYGPMSDKVKMVCDNFLSCRYPSETAGSIPTREKFDRASPLAGDGPVLLIAHIQAKDGKRADIIQAIGQLASVANDGTVLCFGNAPEADQNDIEWFELSTNNNYLMEHLKSEKGQELVKSICDNAVAVDVKGYGTLLPEAVTCLAQLGVNVVAGVTDIGYVLHPQADIAGN